MLKKADTQGILSIISSLPVVSGLSQTGFPAASSGGQIAASDTLAVSVEAAEAATLDTTAAAAEASNESQPTTGPAILPDAAGVLNVVQSRARSLAYSLNLLGFYGGNQESPIAYYEDGHHLDELQAILAKYPCFSGFSPEDMHFLLEGISENGCTYTAMANAIMEKYFFNPTGYTNDFGFTIYRPEGNKQVLNYEPLITDIYCFAVQSRCAAGQKATPDLYKGLSRSEFGVFADYVAAKTDGRVTVQVATKDFDPGADWTALMDEGSIAVSAFAGSSYLAIRSGTSVSFQSLEPGEGHATSLTGVEVASEPYSYMVSSWGNAYYVTDLGFADYCLEAPGSDPKYYKGTPPSVPAGATLYNIRPWIVTVHWSE
ncbi:MAG: hypothetical protein FWF30_00280 [Coriobacteriia bacterium]|nr:hypothetical protein [Coriobacteriia bacterium]